MNTEGIKFIDGIFDSIVLNAGSCNCDISGKGIKDIVTDIVVVVIVKPPGS